MKNILYIFVGIVFGSVISSSFFIYTERQSSTIEIEKDISRVTNILNSIREEDRKYSGGIVKSLLQVQIETYNAILSSLELKKESILHRINFNFTPMQVVSQRESEKTVSDIDKEIQELNEVIESDQRESDKYAQCLIKSLIETRIGQRKLILAGLERALIAKQYGIPMLVTSGEMEKKVDGKDVIPDPEKDKNAL